MSRIDLWTDEQDALLRKLWCEEGLSGSAIGERLGKSRSAILGRVHRLKLEKRVTNAAQVHAGKRKSRSPGGLAFRINRAKKDKLSLSDAMEAVLGKPGHFVEDNLDAVDVTHLIGVMDLTSKTCRWPHGDPKSKGFGFCGQDVKQGSAYCERHHDVAYAKA